MFKSWHFYPLAKITDTTRKWWRILEDDILLYIPPFVSAQIKDCGARGKVTQKKFFDYYCKRPILCLASSKILTPPPPSPPGECVPPAFVAGNEVNKEQPSYRNLSATATRVLQCTCPVAASWKYFSAIHPTPQLTSTHLTPDYVNTMILEFWGTTWNFGVLHGILGYYWNFGVLHLEFWGTTRGG
jgi:hypothetical protein